MEHSIVAIALIFLANSVKIGSSQGFQQCYESLACSTGSELADTGITDARSCCIADTSLAYTDSSGNCAVCNLVGWEKNQITIQEDGVQVNESLSFSKGSGASVPFLLLDLDPQPITADTSDYNAPPRFQIFLINGGSVQYQFLGNCDLSQEGPERFNLVLTLFIGSPSLPSGVFLRDTLEVTITDLTRSSVVLTSVVSVVMFIVGVVVGFAAGAIVGYCCAHHRKPPPPSAALNEEVVLPTTQRTQVQGELKLKDNVAYGHVAL